MELVLLPILLGLVVLAIIAIVIWRAVATARKKPGDQDIKP